MKCMILLAVGLSTLAIGTTVQAATLTFEGSDNTQYNGPIIRDGFTIGNPSGDEQHFHEFNPSLIPGTASNGTGALINDRNTRIFIQAVDLSSFTLGNFDIASGFGSTFTVTGFLGGTQTGIVNGTLTGSFVTFSGASLGLTDNLVFDGSGGDGGFSLDNVNLAAGVPEPTSWMMMITGFGAIGASMRTSRRVKTTITHA